MRLLRFQTVTFRNPENFDRHAYLVHNYRGRPIGVDVQWGPRGWRWLWRLKK